MQKNMDIYNYDKLFERVFKQLKNELSGNNFEVIQRYERIMVTESLAQATRLKHLKMLLSLTRLHNKDWADLTKSDIDDLVYHIMKKYGSTSGQESETSRDHKKVLKIFFRWLKLGSRDKDSVGDPPETKSIKLKKPKDKIVREDLLTEADRTRLLYACRENQRDRAFIDCHLEAGTRPGEILSLRIRHVKFDKYGAVIHVDGKTGPRPVRLIRSTPNLAQWMAVHPFKDNSEAPLWIMTDKQHYGEPLTYSGARKIVQQRTEKANLSKRVFLNLFRHTEATETARFMTEAEMKKRHGWANDSKMPGRYVHLVNADVEEAILSHYGLSQEEQTQHILPKKCHVCDMPNPMESKICTKCGKPLDLKTAAEMDEKQESLSLKIDDQSVRITRLENNITEIKMLLTAGRKPSKMVRLTPEIQFIV
jgi:integrase